MFCPKFFTISHRRKIHNQLYKRNDKINYIIIMSRKRERKKKNGKIIITLAHWDYHNWITSNSIIKFKLNRIKDFPFWQWERHTHTQEIVITLWCVCVYTCVCGLCLLSFVLVFLYRIKRKKAHTEKKNQIWYSVINSINWFFLLIKKKTANK